MAMQTTLTLFVRSASSLRIVVDRSLRRAMCAGLVTFTLLTGGVVKAQCLTGNDSGFPAFTPTCAGAIETVSSTSSAGVYNTVNLTAGSIYTFRSSVGTDYITISNSAGSAAVASGFTPVSFSPTSSGVYRFYLHTNASCGTQAVSRTRTIACTLNDLVCNATPILPGSTILGSTGATTSTGTYEGTTTCGVAQSQPGVWYSVGGVTGATFLASLCQNATAFDTRISVYSGTCTSLVCIGGNDSNGPGCSGSPASFAWPTTTGVTYYIKVHGNTGTGTFTLTLSPANDQVCAAQAITCGSSVSGSTVNATGTGTNEGGDVCGFGQGSIPAVWYSIQGTTGTTITASLCATLWDSRIGIYSGTCTGLTCIGGNDSNGPACASQSASYSWPSLTGTTYYIKVYGFSTSSDFTLNVTCVDVVPANDLACNAQVISCGTTTSGYTVNATNTGTYEGANTCGVGQSQPGVWYTMNLAAGTVVTASLCGTSAWNSRLSVYSGTCAALTCIGGNDDNGPACSGTPASFTWTAASTGSYFIKVHGATSNAAFSLNATCVLPPPVNDDVCNAAFVFGCATNFNVNVASATSTGPFEGSSTCGVQQTQPAVWYYLLGSTGTTQRLSTCSPSNNDTRISVYTGTCTALTCIGGNDDNGPLCSSVSASYSFPTTTGVTYFIKVQAPPGTPTFSLELTCLPTNDLVCDAQPVACNSTTPGITFNSTSSGTYEGNTCGVAQTFGGVWYTVPGVTGNIHTASMCGTSAWNSRISVYSGTCTALTCIGGNDDDGPSCSGTPASFSWPGSTGTTYYIKVHGATSNSNFNLSVSCAPPAPPNDLVCNAQAVACGSSTPGTTVNATSTGTYEGTTACGVAQSQPAVWYTTTGTTGQVITASLCATSGWDSRIAVYSGTCGALTCIGGNDTNGPTCSGNAASYQWAATTGVTYYIKVFGNSGTSAFTLNVSCGAPPSCNAAYTAPANGADVCSATTVTLSWPAVATATGYDVYLDQGSANLLASSNQAGTSYVATVAAGTPYSWRVVPRNANGTPTAACPVWSFTRYAPPAPASVGGPQTICPLGTTSQLSATPSIGTWSVVSGGTGTFSNASSWFATFTHTSGAGPIVLRWTITSGSCPPSTGDVTVNITPAPSTATVGGTQTICALGTTTGLGGNTPSAGTGSWSVVSGGSGTFSNTGAPNATFTHTSGAGPIVLRWTITSGTCGSSAADVVVNIAQPPSTATVGSNLTICRFNITPGLGGNTPSVGIGNWSVVSGGTGFFSNVNLPNATFAHTGGTGPLVLRWTISNSTCTPSFADVTVNISQPPTTATVGGPQTICGFGTTTGLGGNTPTAGTGQWSVVSGGTGTFSNATASNATFTHTGGAGPIVLAWSISNSPCASSSAQVNITIAPTPTIAVTGGPQTICPFGSSAGLGGNTPDVGTGLWSVASGGTGTFNPNASTPNATFTHTGGSGPIELRWTISDAFGCGSSYMPVIITLEEPTIAIAGGPQSICANGTTSGLGGNNPVVGTGGWIVAGGGTGTFAPDASAPNATFTHTGGSGSVELRWTITSTLGCGSSYMPVMITVEQPTTWYADADGDGAGDPAVSQASCTPPPGFVANTNDQCPGDADKTAPGACGCGTPDVDSDSDGLADCIDSCPNTQGVIGSVCNDGDPTTENDVLGPDCQCTGTPAALFLQVRMVLEGAYDPSLGLMRDSLRVLASFPLAQPYSGAAFDHPGNETVTPAVLAASGPNAIVDWVLIELRDPANTAVVLHSRAGLLQRDGDVVDVDGLSALRFVGVAPGSYRVAVRHRNHLGVMTATDITLGAVTATVDLTLTGTAVEGGAARKSLGGSYPLEALWAGDANADGRVVYTNMDNDRDVILQRIGGTIPTNTVEDYLQEDLNLDGEVKYTGGGNDRDLILQNIGGVVPTAVKQGSLP
jgi:hypothetical protein